MLESELPVSAGATATKAAAAEATKASATATTSSGPAASPAAKASGENDWSAEAAVTPAGHIATATSAATADAAQDEKYDDHDKKDLANADTLAFIFFLAVACRSLVLACRRPDQGIGCMVKSSEVIAA